MNERREFPRRVRVITHTWIPLRDGCRLAARIWLPDDAEQDSVPAILEYIPYRKSDATLPSDVLRHPYFAGFGYASVRVDLRGSGDSDGVLPDEYLVQEQEDALDVIAWLAAQPWCSGAVGMMGYSWGGFSALQVAARRPPQLAAIITCNSADNRYTGDCHHAGGSVLAYDMLSWATTFMAFNSRPPDPAVVGDDWKRRWLDRLEACKPVAETWLSHQLYDAYWRHGSVCEDYGAITCPVLAVGGWSDPYHNTVLNLLEGLAAPRLGLIGPWAHGYPDEAVPGPQIGFAQECLRWWDRWLKGIENGVMDEPMLRAWVMDYDRPATFFEERSGRWVGVEHWPSPAPELELAINDEALGAVARVGPPVAWRGVETTGLGAGSWCPYGGKSALPTDQRADDGQSLVFDSQPLTEDVDVLGFPRLSLQLEVDRPLAFVAARLCDLSPDGSSALVTRGLLNLTHRESHSAPTCLEPGRRYRVDVRMDAAGYRFAKGHRLRLALASAYWPWIWPSPEAVTLKLYPGTSTLRLPLLSASPRVPAFPPVEVAPPMDIEVVEQAEGKTTVSHDVGSGLVQVSVEPDYLTGAFRIEDLGLTVGNWGENEYSIVEGDPLSASASCRRRNAISREGWSTTTSVESTLSCDASSFRLQTTLKAFDGETLFFERSWSSVVPRQFG
jgi:putative CocE/NonD family hydrolase